MQSLVPFIHLMKDPAIHIPPNGPPLCKKFLGDYEFVLDNNFIKAMKGDVISITKEIPHRFVVDNTGASSNNKSSQTRILFFQGK